MRPYRRSPNPDDLIEDEIEFNSFSWSSSRFPMCDETNDDLILAVAGHHSPGEPLDNATRAACR